MEINCNGRRAVVSAAGSGIGRTIAEKLADNGAQVFVCDIVPKFLDDLSQKHPEIGSVIADVGQSGNVERLFDAAVSAMGGVDILINNAGIAGPTKRVEDITPSEWQHTLAVDLDGAFYCTRRAVPLMKEVGRGTIIFISSSAGRLAYPLRLPYATAKRALIGMSDTLAMELGPANISVNTILPGYVENARGKRVLQAKADASGQSYEDMRNIVLNTISMRCAVAEGEIANLAVYLCSHQGRHISGQAIDVDGNLETHAGMDNLD